MTTLRLHVVEVVHVVHVVYVVHVVHVQHYSSLSDSTFSPYASFRVVVKLLSLDVSRPLDLAELLQQLWPGVSRKKVKQLFKVPKHEED